MQLDDETIRAASNSSNRELVAAMRILRNRRQGRQKNARGEEEESAGSGARKDETEAVGSSCNCEDGAEGEGEGREDEEMSRA